MPEGSGASEGSGDNDGNGTDPLSQLLSWGEPEHATEPEHASDAVAEAEAVPDAGAVADGGAVPESEAVADGGVVPESEAVPDGEAPGGVELIEAPGGAWLIGAPDDLGASAWQQGYGPVQYGQSVWPPPGWSQPQADYQLGHREPPAPRAPKRPPRTLPGWFGVALTAALVGAVVGGGVVAIFASKAPQTIVREYFPEKSGKVKVGDIQSILASVLPSVVSIDTSSFRGVGGLGSFVQGAGTGMIIEPSGVILTNDHVIAGAQSVTVTLYGQVKQFPAKVIGTDPEKDIALVQVEGAGDSLPTVQFGNSDAAKQGDGVLAIGNALALAGGPTVTEGIVSALNRSLTATTDEGTTENLTGLIQTDAPINPGNSGGPLVNSSGQVVAMNTAVATSSQGNAPAQNVGFAIAVDEIRTVVNQILKR